MRVVAGTVGGRRLVTPAGRDVRPTTDRVREALFGALGSLGAVDGARVLDLFAGSGALGIEALSRGALHATLVDNAAPSLAAVRANLAALDLDARATVVRGEAPKVLAQLAGPFDLVLLDPPYAWNDWPGLLDALLPHLDGDAVCVVESDREVDPGPGWDVVRSRRYGGTWVLLLRPPAPSV